MDNEPIPSGEKREAEIVRQVAAQAARMQHSRQNPSLGVWFGLGMTGLIGWSVVLPTLLGAALGLWLDRHHSGSHSWTLPLMVGGLVLGCFNAWHWVTKEDKAMHGKQGNHHE